MGRGRTAWVAILALATTLLPLIASADYSVRHQIDLSPGGVDIPAVTAHTFQHAFVHDPDLRFSVNPPDQPPVFTPDVRDLVNSIGQIVQTDAFAPLNVEITPILQAGGDVTRVANVERRSEDPLSNRAQARSVVRVNPFAAGGSITGFMRVNGFAEARRGDAYAFS